MTDTTAARTSVEALRLVEELRSSITAAERRIGHIVEARPLPADPFATAMLALNPDAGSAEGEEIRRLVERISDLRRAERSMQNEASRLAVMERLAVDRSFLPRREALRRKTAEAALALARALEAEDQLDLEVRVAGGNGLGGNASEFANVQAWKFRALAESVLSPVEPAPALSPPAVAKQRGRRLADAIEGEPDIVQ